jgi:Cdc6-like AAA superfamily ATPase
MSVTWKDLGFDINPFFLEALTSSRELEFFGDRDSETADMLAKITQKSIPFVLEGDVGSGKTTLLANVSNELVGSDGAKVKKNKCLLVIVNSENVIEKDLTKFALSKLIYLILTDKRFEDIREKIKTSENVDDIPPVLYGVDDSISDLMARFGMPRLSFEQLVSKITEGGTVIFALDDLDKIKDEEIRGMFVKQWRHSVQEIHGISTIYVGNYGLDGLLRKVPGFFAHNPTRMESINKEDLKSILDKRIKNMSTGNKISTIDNFIDEDIWGLLHKVNRGERLRWILETLSRVIERYMGNITKDDLKIPIKYADIEEEIEEFVEEMLNVPDNLIPITNRIVELFLDSIEKLTRGELTDDDWKSGVWGNHSGLVGAEVVVDGAIETLPGSPQSIGPRLIQLEQMRLLASKTIKRKYYLPTDDFMLFLKVKAG